MVHMQMIKQELLDVLALNINFSGIEPEVNQKFEGPSTDSE